MNNNTPPSTNTMSSHDQAEEQPSNPAEKHTLNNHTEPKDIPAPKHEVNYEDAFKPEGDTLRRKISESGSEDVEPSQVKDETAKSAVLMKSGTSKAKKETSKAHWIRESKECEFRPKGLREGMAVNLRLGNAYTDDWSQFAV
jgi:hypothetical protein